MNLQQLMEKPIVGNFNSDQRLWTELEDFIMNESNTMADRIVALRRVDELLGDDVEVNENDVNEYTAMMRTERGE